MSAIKKKKRVWGKQDDLSWPDQLFVQHAVFPWHKHRQEHTYITSIPPHSAFIHGRHLAAVQPSVPPPTPSPSPSGLTPLSSRVTCEIPTWRAGSPLNLQQTAAQTRPRAANMGALGDTRRPTPFDLAKKGPIPALPPAAQPVQASSIRSTSSPRTVAPVCASIPRIPVASNPMGVIHPPRAHHALPACALPVCWFQKPVPMRRGQAVVVLCNFSHGLTAQAGLYAGAPTMQPGRIAAPRIGWLAACCSAHQRARSRSGGPVAADTWTSSWQASLVHASSNVPTAPKSARRAGGAQQIRSRAGST